MPYCRSARFPCFGAIPHFQYLPPPPRVNGPPPWTLAPPAVLANLAPLFGPNTPQNVTPMREDEPVLVNMAPLKLAPRAVLVNMAGAIGAGGGGGR